MKNFKAILEYEKSKPYSTELKAKELIIYFGVDSICKLYGCSVVSTKIAEAILIEVLKWWVKGCRCVVVILGVFPQLELLLTSIPISILISLLLI